MRVLATRVGGVGLVQQFDVAGHRPSCAVWAEANMPGIVGIVSPAAPDECQRTLWAMIGSMKHDPAYASGSHCFPNFGVYAGWVAHEGSFSARQSALRAHDDSVLVFSGECFPSPGLPDAAEPGVAGPAGRDSLLDRYSAAGPSFVKDLNGLFSGVVIDSRQRRALLFNDRYGFERIYLHEKDGAVYFATEAKALLSVLPELRSFDDAGVAHFLRYGCTLDGRTLFRNIRLLPGGSLWTFDRGCRHREERYFLPAEWESQPVLDDRSFCDKLEEVLTRIVPAYSSSEREIGISITGGLDTRMIMACLKTNGHSATCYTFAGIDGETLDVKIGRRVAVACGLKHDTLRIGNDFLSNYGSYVDRTVLVTDGCAGALAAHEIYLNTLARQRAPIRLTGNFGSEILRGMKTLEPVDVSPELVRYESSVVNRPPIQEVGAAAMHPVAFAANCEIPWGLYGIAAAAKSQLTLRTPYLDNGIVALAMQASERARTSPEPSLEFIHRRYSALARIPTDRGLSWGDNAVRKVWNRLFAYATFKADYLDKEGLPNRLAPLQPLINSLSVFGLLGLHKFLPYRKWFRRELAGYVRDVLTDAQTHRLIYWNAAYISTMRAEIESGRGGHLRNLHAVLTLEAVDRLLIRSTGLTPLAI